MPVGAMYGYAYFVNGYGVRLEFVLTLINTEKDQCEKVDTFAHFLTVARTHQNAMITHSFYVNLIHIINE